MKEGPKEIIQYWKNVILYIVYTVFCFRLILRCLNKMKCNLHLDHIQTIKTSVMQCVNTWIKKWNRNVIVDIKAILHRLHSFLVSGSTLELGIHSIWLWKKTLYEHQNLWICAAGTELARTVFVAVIALLVKLDSVVDSSAKTALCRFSTSLVAWSGFNLHPGHLVTFRRLRQYFQRGIFKPTSSLSFWKKFKIIRKTWIMLTLN